MTLVRWSPLEEMGLLRHQLDRLFDNTAFDASTRELKATNILPIELIEKGNVYTVRLAMPGFEREDIKIESTPKELSITAKRQARELEADEHVHVSEFSYGNFSKHLTFPTEIDTQNVAARYELGILTVTVPKQQSSQPRQVEIQIS